MVKAIGGRVERASKWSKRSVDGVKGRPNGQIDWSCVGRDHFFFKGVTVFSIMMRTPKLEDAEDDGHQAFKEVLDEVLDLHITGSKDAIIEKIEETFCQQSVGLEIIATNSTMAVEVLDNVSVKVSKFSDQLGTTIEIVKRAQSKADRSDRISHQVRGKLGAQERKRRKVDTDEISRLRNELGVLKRQMRDKDRMFSTQIQRLADAVERVVAQSGR